MPSLTITASPEQFNQAVEALCFHGRWLESDGIPKQDFAVDQLKKWLGERIYEHAKELVERAADAQRSQIREAITESGTAVEITVTE